MFSRFFKCRHDELIDKSEPYHIINYVDCNYEIVVRYEAKCNNCGNTIIKTLETFTRFLEEDVNKLTDRLKENGVIDYDTYRFNNIKKYKDEINKDNRLNNVEYMSL